MKTAVVTVAVTVSFVVTGCASGGGSQSSSDCSAQVRADGIVYTSHGYTERSATRYCVREEADCADVGPDAAGSLFPESPRHVTTWTFVNYPPAKVLGIRAGSTDSFAVFVADSVPAEERDRIYEDLATERARNARTSARRCSSRHVRWTAPTVTRQPCSRSSSRPREAEDGAHPLGQLLDVSIFLPGPRQHSLGGGNGSHADFTAVLQSDDQAFRPSERPAHASLEATNLLGGDSSR
jgi:hypothetical protein